MRIKRTVIALVTLAVATGALVTDAAAHAPIAHPTMNNSTASVTTLADPAATSNEITESWYDM